MKFSYPVIFIACLASLLMTGCAFKSITRSKDISYVHAGTPVADKQQLNIFAPRKPRTHKEVFVFIHGGSWNKGRKSQYNFLGSRLARKGVVTVIVDYPLSPSAGYNDMARAIAKALQWVTRNIDQYGGDPDKVFVSGHSAGGHLAALLSVRDEYFDSLNMSNPVKGAILIDAAGLDMYGYLSEENLPADHTYLVTFTKNPVYWKEASPLYHLHEGMPPMLIYRGEKTYSSIVKSHGKFIPALKAFDPNVEYHVLKKKKHVGMITQFFRSWSPRYREITAFMKRNG
jgi:acetyl esterase/lipase